MEEALNKALDKGLEQISIELLESYEVFKTREHSASVLDQIRNNLKEKLLVCISFFFFFFSLGDFLLLFVVFSSVFFDVCVMIRSFFLLLLLLSDLTFLPTLTIGGFPRNVFQEGDPRAT